MKEIARTEEQKIWQQIDFFWLIRKRHLVKFFEMF